MQKTRTAPVVAKDAKGNRRVSLAMTAQQRAKINQDNVNRITHKLEEIHDEMHELDDIIFFVEHSALVKIIIKILMQRAKGLMARAWRAWSGDCVHAHGFATEKTIVELEPQVAAAKLQLGVATEFLEDKMRMYVEARMSSMDMKKRTFLMGIFGKNGPEAKRAGFYHWKTTAMAESAMFKTWSLFFAKITNMKVYMAWRKWMELIYEANLPPETVIKHLTFEVNKARKEMEIHEAALERIVKAQMDAMFDGLTGSQKGKLKHTMTNMFNNMQRIALIHWQKKNRSYLRYKHLQIGMLNRMSRAFLNKGWIAWEFHFKASKEFDAKLRAVRLQKTIDTFKEQIAKLDAVLKDQLAEVDIMRQCVTTQVECAQRVTMGREKVAANIPGAIGLCEEDLTPQIDAAFQAEKDSGSIVIEVAS